MRKSVVILVFVLALSQLGNVSSRIDIVPTSIGKTELSNSKTHVSSTDLEDDAEQKKKTVVLLIPVESSEETDEPPSWSDDEAEPEEETEEIVDVPHHSHKTKRCKSPSSLRKIRRIPVAKDPRKYISVSTESSVDESLEIPISGKPLFRIASVKDAKKILKNLLKPRATRHEDNAIADAISERVSRPRSQDRIKLVSKKSDRLNSDRPKKYVCYCLEEDCGVQKSGKKTFAAKKRIGPNILSKSSYTANYEGQEGTTPLLGTENLLGSPNNLHCPPGAVLMEEPEYLKHKQQHLQRRPANKFSGKIAPTNSEVYSLGHPTKIRIPLGSNRKWNHRVYKVDGKSPFAQKLQSVIEQKEAKDRLPCPEPQSSFDDPQNVDNYYNNDQINFNQYHQIPVVPNLVYPGPYAVYPEYPQYSQYPQYPQYGDALHNPISLEPSGQGFVGRQEPSHDPYVPTQLGRNFVDIDQCIKMFGRNFCIIGTSSVSPVQLHQYANNCNVQHEESGAADDWENENHSITESTQPETSGHQVNAHNADKATTHYYVVGATHRDAENSDHSQESVEDEDTTPYYSSQPVDVKFQTVGGSSRTTTSGYETIGSKHEEQSRDFQDYENLVDPESPVKHSEPNSEYLIPIEDSYETETGDYSGNSEELDENQDLQKISDEGITQLPVIAISQKFEGAHGISSPRYIEFTVKPNEEDVSEASSEDDSEETSYDTSEFGYSTNGPRIEDSSKSTTESPRAVVVKLNRQGDDPRATLRMQSQKVHESPTWQQVTTVYPIFHIENRAASTLLPTSGPNYGGNENSLTPKYDVYHSAVSEGSGANFRAHSPKMTTPHRQFVGNTQSTPTDNYSKTEFVSNESQIIKKMPSHLESKEPASKFESAVAKATTSHRKFVGRPQSTAVNNFSKSGFISSPTVGGNDRYTTSYATMAESRSATTPILGAKEVEKGMFDSTSYSTVHGAKETKTTSSWLQKNEEKHANNIEEPTWARYHPSQSGTQDASMNQHFATKGTFYPQLLGTHQSTVVDSSTQPEQSDKKMKTTSSWPEENEEPNKGNMEESTWTEYYPTQSETQDTSINKYFTTQKTFYPQLLGSHLTTYADGPTQLREGAKNTKTTSSRLENKEKPENNVDETAWAQYHPKHSDVQKVTVNQHHTTKETFYPQLMETHQSTVDGMKKISTWPEENQETHEGNIEETISTQHYPTQSGMQDTSINKHFTTKKAFYPKILGTHQSTLVDSSTHPERVGASYKSTKMSSLRPFSERIPQSMPFNQFAKSERILDATTSYATMENSRHDTTPVLAANKPNARAFTSYSLYPTAETAGDMRHSTTSQIKAKKLEEGIFTSTTYPSIHGAKQTKTTSSWSQDDKDKHQANIGAATWTGYHPINSEMQDTSTTQHHMPEENSYPQYVGSYPLTPVDGSTHTGQLGVNFETRKPSSRRPFIERITQSTQSNDFTQSGSTPDDETSFASMATSTYDATPLLRANEPEESEFASYSPYPTTIETDEGKSTSSWLQDAEENDEDSTEKTPSSLYYSTQSEIADADDNTWSENGKTKSSHRQFVGRTQSTPVDDFSRPGIASTTTSMGANSHYTTSYATIEDMDHSTTSVLKAEEPEEETYLTYPTIHGVTETPTVSSSPQENTEKHGDYIDETSWSQYYPTQSGGQDTSVHQHFTEKNIYPQFVGSHRSTVVDSSTEPKSLGEHFKTTQISSQKPFVGRIEQSTPFDNIVESERISDATTSYATMENSRYGTIPLLGSNKPEDQTFLTYSSYPPTSQTDGNSRHSATYGTTYGEENVRKTSTWPQKYKEEHQDNIKETSLTQRYPMQSKIHDMSTRQHFTTGKNMYPQYVGYHQSTRVDSSTEPEQLGGTSETRKMSSLRPFAGRMAQSTPFDQFPKSGSVSDATTSYATMENSSYDTTATKTEGGTRHSTTYPIAHDAEEMRTTSSWPKDLEERHRDSTDETSWTQHYPTQSGRHDTRINQHFATEKNSYPQFVGAHQTANDVGPSTSFDAARYVTTERNSYPQFGTEASKDIANNYNDADFRKWYHSTANQDATTNQSAHRQILGAHHSSPVQSTLTTTKPNPLKMPMMKSSNTHWRPTTERSERHTTATQSTRPVNIIDHRTTTEQAHVGSNMATDDINSNEDFRNRYTSTETVQEEPVTTGNIYSVSGSDDDVHDEYSPSTVESNELFSPSGDRDSGTDSEKTLGKPYKQSEATPRTAVDSGIKEESNAYFTSKSYDSDADAVTGPDSYFEGGLKNWNDFTSMSSDDLTVSEVNRAKEINDPMITNLEDEESQTTNYEVVGGELTRDESTTNDEFNEEMHHTTDDDFSSTEILTQRTNGNTRTVKPEQNYEDDLKTVSDDDRQKTEEEAEEEVGKPIQSEEFGKSDSSTPSGATHDSEVDSASSETLIGKIEDLNGSSTENARTDYSTTDVFSPVVVEESDGLNTDQATVVGSTSELGDYNDSNYPMESDNNLPSTAKIEGDDSSTVASTEDNSTDANEKLFGSEENMQQTTAYNAVVNEGDTIISTRINSITESSEILQSTLTNERITQPDNIAMNNPISDQSTSSYEYADDALSLMTTPEDESKEQTLTAEKTDTQPTDHEYPDFSSLEQSSTPEFSKYQDVSQYQKLGYTLIGEPTSADEVSTSSIVRSEPEVPGRSSESVGAPVSKTTSDSLRSTTTRSANYDDFSDFGTTEGTSSYSNYIEGQIAPTVDSTKEISDMSQLSPNDRNILRLAVEKVVNDLVSSKSDVIGAPSHGLLPGFPELPILKNLFSLPDVRNMAINTVKGVISEASGVPRDSSLGRLADHLIDSVLHGVVDNALPGPVTTTSSGIVDEHRFENGQWTVVPVTLIPRNDHVAQRPADRLSKTIEDIVANPGIGLQGARLPIVQNIIVRTVENALQRAKHVVDHSVIWDTLNSVIARAEKPVAATHETVTTVKSMRKMPITKKPGGSLKNIPVIPVTEHVFKNGQWSEKQTVLGAKQKFQSDNQLRHSTSSHETSTNTADRFDYTTKAGDYAFIGESDELGFTQENSGPNAFGGITETIVRDNEEDLEKAPIKYYSPNDRILSYIKNHQTPSGIVGSREKSQTTPRSLNIDESPEADWASNETKSNELTTTDYSLEFPQPTQEKNEDSEETSVGSTEKSTACTCKKEEKKINDEKVASQLQSSSQASIEDENYSDSTTNVHQLDELDESTTRNYVGERNSFRTLETQRNSGEELASTEISQFLSTIHHLNVDHEDSDYTTEDYIANGNPSITEESDRSIAQVGDTKSEEYSEEETLNVTTDSHESTDFSIPEEHNKNIDSQIASTPVYVYGVPFVTTRLSGSRSRPDEKIKDSTERENISKANVLATEEYDQDSDEEEASNETMESNESPTVSDVTKEIIGAANNGPSDQSITTPVYFHGVPMGSSQLLKSTPNAEANVLTTATEDETTDSNDSETIADLIAEVFGTHHDGHTDQSISTPVYVYGVPVGSGQFSGSKSQSAGPYEESASEEHISQAHMSTTASFEKTNSEKVQSPGETTQNNGSGTIGDLVEEVFGTENHRQADQSLATPVYVYGVPVGSSQFPQSATRKEGVIEKSANNEYIGQANALTTTELNENSDEAGASDESTESYESPSISDVTDETIEAANHRLSEQSITTPVYVYGVPVSGKGELKTTVWNENATPNLGHRFAETSEHHDSSHQTTASIFAATRENMEKAQFPRVESTSSHLKSGIYGQREEFTTHEYAKLANALTTDYTDENLSDETSNASTEPAKSGEISSEVTAEILQAERNDDVRDDISDRVHVYGAPVWPGTTPGARRKITKTTKNYGSIKEAATSSPGLTGAARGRVERPQLQSFPRQRLGQPGVKITNEPRVSSGRETNKCATAKYDPTYFGKISLNGVNPGGNGISGLTNSDLFYVGDGVKIPLTIQRMPDGSYALSISEKICENFVKRKCPCCVPREGDIVEERRRSNEDEDEDDDTSVQRTSYPEDSYDSFEPTESPEFRGKTRKRYVRSTSGSEVVITSATPVKNFVKKYNLTLSLNDGDSPLAMPRKNDEADVTKSGRSRKSRLSSSRDAKICNLYGDNNEIRRDDEDEETEKRDVGDVDEEAVSKGSNSIRKVEFTYETGTNDFIESLMHIKDAPEDKRTEIVLNALDGLVNSASGTNLMNPDDVYGDYGDDGPDQSQQSDEYSINEMENAMARYGYQKDNPILERIRFIKARQDSHGQYKYQKNIDHRAKGKMNMLKTVLHWLREVFLATNANNES